MSEISYTSCSLPVEQQYVDNSIILDNSAANLIFEKFVGVFVYELGTN